MPQRCRFCFMFFVALFLLLFSCSLRLCRNAGHRETIAITNNDKLYGSELRRGCLYRSLHYRHIFLHFFFFTPGSSVSYVYITWMCARDEMSRWKSCCHHTRTLSGAHYHFRKSIFMRKWSPMHSEMELAMFHRSENVCHFYFSHSYLLGCSAAWRHSEQMTTTTTGGKELLPTIWALDECSVCFPESELTLCHQASSNFVVVVVVFQWPPAASWMRILCLCLIQQFQPFAWALSFCLCICGNGEWQRNKSQLNPIF